MLSEKIFLLKIRISRRCSLIQLLTAVPASEETSLSLVCEENLGSGILTEITAVKPSLISSGEAVTFFILLSMVACSAKYFVKVLVIARLKPAKC